MWRWDGPLVQLCAKTGPSLGAFTWSMMSDAGDEMLKVFAVPWSRPRGLSTSKWFPRRTAKETGTWTLGGGGDWHVPGGRNQRRIVRGAPKINSISFDSFLPRPRPGSPRAMKVEL